MKTTTWKLPEHTRAKHQLLQHYLAAWFPILALSQRQRRVIFIDGFAGPGVYSDGESGSPLIALETLIHHSHFDQFTSTEFVFIFVESDKTRCQHLSHTVSAYWDSIGGRPSNVRVLPIQADFVEVASRIAEIGPGRLAPTLAFIDPFGWSSVPMTAIGELLSSDKCEVIINFMFDHVNRFVNDERPGIVHSFAELFATGDYEHRHAGGLSGNARKELLRDLYASQLEQVAGFTYVNPFEVMDVNRNRTAYYLMFGTRSLKGLEVMKDAMWDLDPVNGVRFSGFVDSDAMLFKPTADLEPLRHSLIENFVTRTISVEEIEEFVLAGTDFRLSHYKGILRDLERQGWIRGRSHRDRKLTYPKGTILEFLDRTARPSLFYVH